MKTVVLAQFADNFQANILQDVLTNEGIKSFTKNETLSSMLNIPAYQIEILVFEDDYKKAREIFEKGFPDLAKE